MDTLEKPDPRDFLQPKLTGYRGTANLMGSYSEVAIFRRFLSAGALDLLYQQADLQHHFVLWAKSVAQDANNKELSELDTSYAEQGLLRTDSDKKRGLQPQTWLEISTKLERYYESLLRYQKICNLAGADEKHLQMLQLHLTAKDQGDEYMEAYEADIYRLADDPKHDDVYRADFTSIAKREEEDFFTKFARAHGIDFLRKICGVDWRKDIQAVRIAPLRDVVEYPHKKYDSDSCRLAAGFLYSLLTSALVMLAIWTLNYFQSFLLRILLIMLHVFLFTGAMACTVKGQAGDFFGVAAAYAAVLVVFASNPFTSSPTPEA